MIDNENAEGNRFRRRDTIVGILIIIVGGIAGFLLLRFIWGEICRTIAFLYHKLSKMDAVVSVALITGAFSILAVCISTIVGNIITTQQSKREYLTKKREKTLLSFPSAGCSLIHLSNAIPAGCMLSLPFRLLRTWIPIS